MRFKLLRRRLTISAPRVAVRSALPWPFRWVLIAIVLGFSAAIALWAFEIGKGLAGVDSGAKEELVQLKGELQLLRDERNRAQSIANTADSLLTTEKVARERLTAQLKQLDAENRALRDDLGFFEKLLPTGSGDGIAIRGLQAETIAGSQLKWQALVIQPARGPADFNGKLEISFAGIQNGKPWMQTVPEGPQAIQVKLYRRIEGIFELPPNTVVKTVSAKLMEGAAVRAVQTVTLLPL